jgi:tetratricopeptide (TPR) repeat protein
MLFGLLPLLAAPGAASEKCASCHPAQAEGFARTGMGRSLGRPTGHPNGRVGHLVSRSTIDISTRDGRLLHRLEREGLVATQNIDFFIGSGNEGRSYMISVAGRLFQSPASYYTARRSWDLSPGYEHEQEVDFDRPITPECLFCHSGSYRAVPFTLNTYEAPAFEAEAITCERCHGDPGSHLARPSAANIVNPAKLQPALRDAVCEQCHLSGEARILNPGRQPQDFQPGASLEDVFTTYVFDKQPSKASEPLKVVSHSEQLAASRCAQASGTRMWCRSCHDPHQKPSNPVAWYRDRCRECHSAASLAHHSKPADDCAGCHMPQRRTYDGGHTAFTDHRIPLKPRPDSTPAHLPVRLRPWRQPPAALSTRNLGLAHISTGERHQSAQHLNEGFRLLSEIQNAHADDAAVLTSLGAVLQRKQAPREAARLFARASRLEPRDARHRLNLGVALVEAGESRRAVEALESAITLDPSLRDAYVLLADIHRSAGDEQKRRRTLERYLAFMPQSIVVRKMLRD